MESSPQHIKACDWLTKHCGNDYSPVAVKRNGYAQFVAYVYRLHRPNKPDVWYCVTMAQQWLIRDIKRICY